MEDVMDKTIFNMTCFSATRKSQTRAGIRAVCDQLQARAGRQHRLGCGDDGNSLP